MYLVLGGLLLLVCFWDLITTVIAPQGAGTLTKRLCNLIATVVRGRPVLRSTEGWLCMVIVLLTWVSLLWLGWWMIFLHQPDSVVASKDGSIATYLEKLYFVGYVLFTLGLGDFVPNAAPWKLLTCLVAACGLMAVTLALSYLTSVLPAVAEKRQLGNLLHDLGSTPEYMLKNHRARDGYSKLFQRLDSTIWPKLNLHCERHLTYPILHNFHATREQDSLALGLARLNEALHLLRSQDENTFCLHNLESTLNHFLETLEDSDFLQVTASSREQKGSHEWRRTRLRAFVKSVGLDWDEVWGDTDTPNFQVVSSAG